MVDKYNMYQFKIFGSRARGDYKKASDIDIAICDSVDEKDKFNIMNDFDLLEIPYMIDVFFLQEISKEEFRKSIERDGVSFYE